MSSAVLNIQSAGGVHCIQVTGRATFECVAPLRSLAKELETAEFKKIHADLSQCTGMDSTFMGILAMLGLRAKKLGAEMVIAKAGELNKSLLFGLGLKKLFLYNEEEMPVLEGCVGTSCESESRLDSAKTVLAAHKTLMDVDDENKKKFEKVVDLVQQDIDRMNNFSGDGKN